MKKRNGHIISKSTFMMVMAVLIGVAMISGAALVGYLSNTATISMKVESPMLVGFDDGTGNPDWTKTTLDLGTVYGGDIITYTSWCKNQANVGIDSYPVTTIISNSGYDWTGQELTSVNFKDSNGAWEILSMLYVVQDDGSLRLFTLGGWSVADKTTLKLVFENSPGALPYNYPVGAQSWNEITIKTAQGIAPGYYSVKLCQLDNLLASCQ